MGPLGGAQSFVFCGSGVLVLVSVCGLRGGLVALWSFTPSCPHIWLQSPWELLEPEKAAGVGEAGSGQSQLSVSPAGLVTPGAALGVFSALWSPWSHSSNGANTRFHGRL